ncbi:unnamed protein product, partial [Brenthis ino]
MCQIRVDSVEAIMEHQGKPFSNTTVNGKSWSIIFGASAFGTPRRDGQCGMRPVEVRLRRHCSWDKR